MGLLDCMRKVIVVGAMFYNYLVREDIDLWRK